MVAGGRQFAEGELIDCRVCVCCIRKPWPCEAGVCVYVLYLSVMTAGGQGDCVCACVCESAYLCVSS